MTSFSKTTLCCVDLILFSKCLRNDAVQLEDKNGIPEHVSVQKSAESYCDDSFEDETSSMEDTTFHSSSASVVLSEHVDKAEKRQTAEENMGNSDSEHVRDLPDKQVFCDRETEEIPSLVENGDSVEHAEQGSIACEDSEHVIDLEDQPAFCEESKEKQSVGKFSGAFKDEECERDKTNGFQEHEEQPYNGSKTVEETPSPKMNISGESNLEERKIEDHDYHKNKKDNKAMARAPSVSSDVKEFEQQTDRFKNSLATRMCEIEKQHSMILEGFAQVSGMARPLVKDKDFVSPLLRVEKEVQLVQDELGQVLDETKNSRMGKSKYKKLKKRFRCNRERINSLVQAYQRDFKERKEKETDFQHQLQHDMGQIRLLLEASKNEVSSSEVREQWTDKDGFDNLKEMNDILEKVILRLKSNENEQELERIAFTQENRNVQGLEDTFKELKSRLEENKCDLESIKRKLKERDDRIEELNLKLQQEREDAKGLKKSIELVEGHARKQTTDKDNELSILRQLLSNTSEHSDKLQAQLTRIRRQLEDTEDTLTQRDTELTEAKASLCQEDEIVCDFKQTLTEMQHQLEETKKTLAAKDKALETASRYADDEVEVLKELVTNVIRDVNTVEQAHVKLQTLLVDKDKNAVDRELFIVQLKEGLETVIFELKKDLDLNMSSLKEKDQRVEELELSIVPLKKDLDIKTSSLREKDSKIKDLESSIALCKKNLALSCSSLTERNNKIDDLEASIAQLENDLEVASISLNGSNSELQQIQGYVQEKERELDISNGKVNLLKQENDCLKNKYMMLKTHLSQQGDEIQELKKLAFTRNSELREGNRELEKLRHLLQEKEQRIEFMKRSLVAKEHDNDILTGNMKKRFFEIRSLQRTLDEVNNEKRKLSELYRLKKSYFETKIKRLNMEVECNHILIGKKERALETANLEIQAKEGELEILKDRLCKQEINFELYKKISTEAEYKLLQEKRSLEKAMKVAETGLCEKDNRSVELDSSSSAKESDLETIDDWSSDESNRLFCYGKGELVISKEAEEKIAVTGTERLAQMEANLIALKKELKRSQDNNAMLSKKNKELKEKVNKLAKQTVLERKRLNNTLDNVHIKAAEIRRLKTLLKKQYEARSIQDDDIQQDPESIVAGAGPKVPGNEQERDVSQMADEVQQELSESELPLDDAMQKTAEPNIRVDDDMKDVLELQVRGDATQKTDDRVLLESRVSENAILEFDYMEMKEDAQRTDDFPQESGELNVLVDDHTMQNMPEPRLSENPILEFDDFEMADEAQRELDDQQKTNDVPKESGEPQLPVDDKIQDETKVLVDDHISDVPEPQVPGDATQEHSQMTDDAQQELNNPQESGEPQLPVDGNRQAEPKVLVDDHIRDVPELPVPGDTPQEHSQTAEDSQQQLDDPQESGEPQLPVVVDRQGLAESQVEEFPQVCSQT